MAYKNTLLQSTGCLRLIKSVKSKGSTKYIIKIEDGWRFDRWKELDNLLDPFGNKLVSSHHDMWKFNKQIEAEELMSLAVLKGLSSKP